MPKRVSEIQKQKISESFVNGMEINEIINTYNFSKQTIIKQLKIFLGEEEFNLINNTRAKNGKLKKNNINPIDIKVSKNDQLFDEPKDLINNRSGSSSAKKNIDQIFFEIPPIINNIDLDNQKDLSSKPLSEANFPSVVYILVDNNIELEPKLLKDFPEWSFLPEDDLNRRTIQIFSNQKLAKQSISKNQKIIKVPNTNVFLIASGNLKSKGISRIIFEDSLLAL